MSTNPSDRTSVPAKTDGSQIWRRRPPESGCEWIIRGDYTLHTPFSHIHLLLLFLFCLHKKKTVPLGKIGKSKTCSRARERNLDCKYSPYTDQEDVFYLPFYLPGHKNRIGAHYPSHSLYWGRINPWHYQWKPHLNRSKEKKIRHDRAATRDWMGIIVAQKTWPPPI